MLAALLQGRDAGQGDPWQCLPAGTSLSACCSKLNSELKFYKLFVWGTKVEFVAYVFLQSLFLSLTLYPVADVYMFIAVLGVHNMVNNPKFDEGGARSKDGKGSMRSKQTFLCGLYVCYVDP